MHNICIVWIFLNFLYKYFHISFLTSCHWSTRPFNLSKCVALSVLRLQSRLQTFPWDSSELVGTTLLVWEPCSSWGTSHKGDLSRRQLTRLEIIGFIYPFYVYDGNRPLTPILRQRQCSLMYDVYWLAWWMLLWGSKYLEYIPESELNIYRVNMKTKQ
jgi:hypothetical protein